MVCISIFNLGGSERHSTGSVVRGPVPALCDYRWRLPRWAAGDGWLRRVPVLCCEAHFVCPLHSNKKYSGRQT